MWSELIKLQVPKGGCRKLRCKSSWLKLASFLEFRLMAHVTAYLEENGIELVRFGSLISEEADYVDAATGVAEALRLGNANKATPSQAPSPFCWSIGRSQGLLLW